MTAIINTPTSTTDRRNTIFDAHLIQRDLTRARYFMLQDGEAKILIPPFCLMPRNYTTTENECEIRFFPGTSYPWPMTLVNAKELKIFPPFTPITRANIEWTDWELDKGIPDDLVAQRVFKKGRFEIPLSNDFNASVDEDENRDEELALPGNLYSTFVQPNQDTICSRTKSGGKIKFVYANSSNFFAAPDNGKPVTKEPAQFLLDRYSSFLDEVAATGGGNSDTATDIDKEMQLMQDNVDQQLNENEAPPPVQNMEIDSTATVNEEEEEEDQNL